MERYVLAFSPQEAIPMKKYPISKQFFPFDRFSPPISRPFLSVAVPFMKPPGYIWRDPELKVQKHKIVSYDGASIETFVMSPAGISENAPCLIYIHGGGFVLEAVGYHYHNAMRYTKEAACKVVFVKYRLAPKHPHPVFFEDCYAAFCWVYDRAEELGIDRKRIGVGGDSAGATLAVGVCMMARDRAHPGKLCFQMLAYPYLDGRNDSESCRKYTDTPMWNSTLSQRIGPMTRADRGDADYIYYSPVEAESLADLPTAYIETAEFDCLHDDGILYAQLLEKEGIGVELNETKGTMHGFDIVTKAPIAREAVQARIAFMKRCFGGTR